MSDKGVIASKFLSFVLRHGPETIGLSLDKAGWAQIDILLARAKEHGVELTRELLEQVVASSDKQRFAISSDGQFIRANQGHSVAVELGLVPQTPPDRLFHGTATRFVESIRRDGLKAGERQHVHLSPDETTARNVGSRHGKPCVLVIDAARMQATGHSFFLSENGVWLAAFIPVDFIEFPVGGGSH
ncbi:MULTISPECIES: RNA 2'-phosphotransferase [Paraburkholderia]|uniref:RNA 2'-phosphotransferase n=1 Tax=Paraburkholderia TaxID=1822464 RepID=UPI00225876DE|nr:MULTISPECIES: RNA 2'-phosphotransferase [Paraburkholderia]MCX4165709.1 RNA 2'-phosphotransferase [Paraburkholderia megapolitana]MDN7161200.1 RNA 2'-phosphotransferase [Paraburkholderia sp. CHISQ3]MDQ6498247.1 RNA 2'-phosphotransferase [Paraburkholderia megapolitana]